MNLPRLGAVLVCLLAQQLASALNLPTTPVGISQSQNSSVATNSYLVVTLSGVPSGYDVTNATYLGWCGESQNTTVDTNAKTAVLYSTVGAGLPVSMQNANWPKVNYVLNHKQGTPDDIQQAIWVLLNGALYDFTGTAIPPSATAQAMVTAANASGAAFTPAGGQVTAVVVYQDGYGSTWQDTIIEVLVPQAALGAVGDYVWMDTDHDGVQDSTEVGINNVKLNLYNSSNALIGSTLTKNNPTTGLPGWYYFDKLVYGSYKVTVDTTTLPAHVSSTYTGRGTPATDSNGNSATAVINQAAPIDITLDFGYYSPGICAYNETFWKANPSKWPVTTLKLGGKTYTQAELITILGMASNSYDDSIALARELIAAKLNYLIGVYESGAASYIAQADAILAGYSGKVPLRVNNNNWLCLTSSLNSYNNPNCSCTKRW